MHRLNARQLVKDLGGQASLHRKLNEGHKGERITLEAIEKWCERDSIPGKWLVELSTLANKEKIDLQLANYIIQPRAVRA